MATVRELRKLASELGVNNYSKLKKGELADAVRAAQAERGLIVVSPAEFSNPEVSASLVASLAAGPLAKTARYIRTMIDRDGGAKGNARKLRKALRAAGHYRHAAVDTRRIDEYERAERNAA